ncbi:hypothetical protein BC829DRAFT_38237 [Chytridium lagenaria]|nr:hypothetical protein BC829DRAFT_38237 [Chytridium lagenaria]
MRLLRMLIFGVVRIVTLSRTWRRASFDEKIRETNWKVDRMVKVLFEMSAGDVIIDDKDLECGYQGDFVVKMNAWTSANESGVIGCAPLDGSTVMVESFTQTTELDNSSALASSKILDSGEIPAVCSPTTATLNKDASILDSNMGCTHIDSSASDNSSALLTSQEACEDPAPDLLTDQQQAFGLTFRITVAFQDGLLRRFDWLHQRPFFFHVSPIDNL